MKKPLIIAIMCHKGGTAKTATTSALADVFLNAGKKVLIVDADEQSNIKTIFGIKLQQSEGGLSAVLLNNVNPSTLCVRVRPALDVLLSGGRLVRDFERIHSNTPGSELLMKKRMVGLSSYDIVLIDTPPAMSLISSNIVAFADYVLLTCSPDLLAFVGVKNTLNFIEGVESPLRKQKASVARVLGVLPTLYDGRRTLDMDILNDLHGLESADLLRGGRVFSPIRIDIKIKTAQVRRKLLSESFPSSKAAEDYFLAAREIIERVSFYEKKQKTAPSKADLVV